MSTQGPVMQGRKSRAKFKVGQRVKFTLEGPIEEMNNDFAYVRVIVRQGDGHVFAQAALYFSELRPMKAAGRGVAQRGRKGI